MAEHEVVVLQPAEGPAGPPGAVLGWIARVDDAGIWVQTEASREPVLALSVTPLSRAELDEAIEARTEAVLLPVEATGQPVLLGLRQPTPPVEAELPAAPKTASVDGETLRLDAHEEIVLRCGKASITMRRNGKIVIRGVQVETRATGRNRIKGGSVLIN